MGVFGGVLVSVVTLMHLYVFLRAASVPLFTRLVPRPLFIGAGALLWGGFVAGRLLGHGRAGPGAAVMELFGMHWMATVFLVFLCLLTVDVVTVFGLLLPRLAPSLRGWAVAAGFMLSAAALFQGVRPPVLTSYEVRLPGLPAEMDGTVVVALSDTHLGTLLDGRWLSALVDRVDSERPDMVVLLGDLFEGHQPPGEGLLAPLRRLSAPLGVWAVPGNHEFHGGGKGTMEVIVGAGIGLLRNRWVGIRPGLVLAGVEDLTHARRREGGPDPLATALAGRPAGATILLSHSPLRTGEAAGAGVGLMLSGHTHGGQIWPFGYLVRLRYPHLAGRYQVGGMTAVVCRGTGTWGPRMRLWRPGEILRVTLRS